MPPKGSKRKSHVLIDNAEKNTIQKNNSSNSNNSNKKNKKNRHDDDNDDNNYEYNDDINDEDYDENEAHDSKYQVHADDEEDDDDADQDVDDIEEDEEDDESESNNRPRIETALFHEIQDADEDHDDDEGTSLSPRHKIRQMEFLNKNAGTNGKKEVRVGHDYQTDIPEFVSPFKNTKERIAIISDARQGRVWKGLMYDEKSTNNYIETCMCKISNARSKVLRIDDKDSNVVDGRLLVLRSDYLEDLLQNLYESNDPNAAIEKISKKADTYLSVWSVDENKLMRKMCTRYGSNLTKLGSSIPTKSEQEVKDFYFKYYQTSIHIERHHNEAKMSTSESNLDVLKDNVNNNNDNEDEDSYGILVYTRVSGSLPKPPVEKTNNLYLRLRNSNDTNSRQVIKKLLIYNFLKKARGVLDNICFGQLLNVILLWQKGIILLPQLIVFVHSICQDMHKYSGTQSSAKCEMVFKEFLILCPESYTTYLLSSIAI